MRRTLVPFALIVLAGCGDPTDAPEETLLTLEQVEPLRIAAADGSARLLPSIRVYESEPVSTVESALTGLEEALETRSPSRIDAAVRDTRDALFVTDPGDPASAPDRAALHLVLDAIERVLANSTPTG
ncbi:MAG: hypothetical protein GWM90_15215 [Gemmatimonadetes bacterium]|nr:hypothetical protein [Gemmatimonadota bacterium]NIR37848.1 hypothetical protein [Actinomycetota bacterium]NIU75756.1 hypothetical protein [Gammaproteobacteria bacterium]NIQ55546.1 hypothetical protein [Gemmatimonadota bacterium]NIX45403.1 hypothetical protein [Gemmatimonadota bacterium]